MARPLDRRRVRRTHQPTTRAGTKQISVGVKALRDITTKAENRAYASSTIYGVSSIQELLPKAEEAIEKKYKAVHCGRNGEAFADIKKYLVDLEPLVAAAITCKMIFDKVFSFKDDDNALTNVYGCIGHAIMAECQMRWYEKEAPGLLHTIKEKYWHDSCGTEQKLTDVKLAMNKMTSGGRHGLKH